jgi:hypothetical protein
MIEPTEGKDYIKTYMKLKKFSSEDIKKVENVTVPNAIGEIARRCLRDISLPADLQKKIDKFVQKVVATAAVEDFRAIEKAKEKLRYTTGLIETVLDDFYRADYVYFEPKVYDLLRARGTHPTKARLILEYYQPLLREVIDAKAGINEGYEKLSKKQLKNYVEFMTVLTGQIKRFITNEKATKVRAPRKRKAKSAAQLTKNLKYLTEFPALNLVSKNPLDIVGASSLWLYNIKSRKLTNLVGTTLSVKGTTVLGFEESLSECRMLRKPETVLNRVIEGSKYQLGHIFKDLTTKPASVKGRINSDTIILRIVK